MQNKLVHYADSPCVGKFNLPYEVLQDGTERPMLQALFGLCVVLESYDHESGRGKTYVAASELFQALTEGEEVPDYRIDFACNRAFDNAEHEQRRINNGDFGFVATRQFILRVPQLQLATVVRTPGHA